MSETNNQKPRVGAVWVKTTKDNKGKFLSLEIEINGKKYNYVGFKNRFKQNGDKQPSYHLFEYNAPKSSVPKQNTTTTEEEEII